MRRQLWVNIDLELLRRHMSKERIRSAQEVRAWLAARGFTPSGIGWVIATEKELGLLDPGEILDCHPATAAEADAADRSTDRSGPSPTGFETEFEADDDESDGGSDEVGSPGDETPWGHGPAGETPRAEGPAGFHLLPAFLWGRHRDVVAKCRPFVRRAVKAGSWDAALRGVEMAPADERPGLFIWKGPSPLLGGEDLLLYPILDLLVDACKKPDRRLWYATQREMLLEGMNHFWFCLAALADVRWLIVTDESEDEAPAVAAAMLPKMLRWWPDFCGLAPRFAFSDDLPVNWPLWGGLVFSLCADLGMPEDEIERIARLPTLVAGDQIQGWLKTGK